MDDSCESYIAIGDCETCGGGGLSFLHSLCSVFFYLPQIGKEGENEKERDEVKEIRDGDTP